MRGVGLAGTPGDSGAVENVGATGGDNEVGGGLGGGVGRSAAVSAVVSGKEAGETAAGDISTTAIVAGENCRVGVGVGSVVGLPTQPDATSRTKAAAADHRAGAV